MQACKNSETSEICDSWDPLNKRRKESKYMMREQKGIEDKITIAITRSSCKCACNKCFIIAIVPYSITQGCEKSILNLMSGFEKFC